MSTHSSSKPITTNFKMLCFGTPLSIGRALHFGHPWIGANPRCCFHPSYLPPLSSSSSSSLPSISNPTMQMDPKKKKRAKNNSPTIENRVARYRYELLERYECGIELVGTEIKSVREGKLQLRDGYGRVKNKNQLYLENTHIAHYKMAGKYFNHETKRSRRLLLHKKDILKLGLKQSQVGLTIIPTKAYFNQNGFLKIEIALARGKKFADKRRTIKERENERELRRVVKSTVNAY